MNKKVLITGASGALGEALVKKFIEEDFNLFLNFKNFRNFSIKTKQLLKSEKNRIKLIKGDLMLNKTLKSISKEIKKNNIEVLINNAGVYLNKEFNRVNNKEIKKVFEINLFSNIFLIKEIFRLKVKKLTIVNINSKSGLQGSSKETIYASSKHALKGFFDSLSLEAKFNNYNFINFYPGAFQSRITKNRIDFKKLMQPDEISTALHSLLIDYKSLKINSVFIGRKNF